MTVTLYMDEEDKEALATIGRRGGALFVSNGGVNS
ncbi:MAG TPA: hypothetical protein V6D43_03840 [Candidatus Sericytochromatia bacterium]